MTKTTHFKPRTATIGKRMDHQSRHSIIIATAILLLCAITTPQTGHTQTEADSNGIHLTTGVRWNQAHPFGILGVTKRISSRIYQYTGFDLGGTERSVTTQTAIRLTPVRRWTLFAILGPQAETIEPEPDADQTITYLTGSTGLVLDYHRNQNLTAFAGISYLWTTADMVHWKFGFGVTLPLSLD